MSFEYTEGHTPIWCQMLVESMHEDLVNNGGHDPDNVLVRARQWRDRWYPEVVTGSGVGRMD